MWETLRTGLQRVGVRTAWFLSSLSRRVRSSWMFNHDMMMICAEAGQRFVWIDPRGRQLSAVEQVLLVFSQIEVWERLLAADQGVCVRSMRTKCEPIQAGEAARLAEQRMRVLRRRQQARRASPLGPLLSPRPIGRQGRAGLTVVGLASSDRARAMAWSRSPVAC